MTAADRIVAGAANAGTSSGWHPVDLGPLTSGPIVLPQPSLLTTDDGHALLYAGKTHLFFGEPESLKTWAALYACAEQLAWGRRVLWVDSEDTAETAVSRLLSLWVEPEVVRDRFCFIELDFPAEPSGVAEFLGDHVTLVVIDALTGVMARLGLDQNDAADNARLVAELAKACCDTGAAVILIDHVPKGDTTSRYPIGSQHKLGAVTGAAYHFRASEPFARGQSGAAIVRVTKDRPGAIRGVANEYLVQAFSENETVKPNITAVAPKVAADADFKPTRYMEKVSRALEAAGEAGLNKGELEARVKGRAHRIREATDRLKRDGYVSLTQEGSAHVYRSLRPYRSDDSPDSHARPSSEVDLNSSQTTTWARPRSHP